MKEDITSIAVAEKALKEKILKDKKVKECKSGHIVDGMTMGYTPHIPGGACRFCYGRTPQTTNMSQKK